MTLNLTPANIQAMPDATFLPETAPFAPGQRAWLNGFFAGLFAGADAGATVAPLAASATPPDMFGDGDAGELVWHDQTIPLDERMTLAQGRPLRRRFMAAMAQQDCGQCGYDCEKYADKIWLGEEPRLNLCAPGGKATQRMLKTLHGELEAGTAPPAKASVPAAPVIAEIVQPGYSRDAPILARFAGLRRESAAASDKETNHVEIDLAGTGLAYAPGDSLGIVPANCASLVSAMGEALGSDAHAEELALRRCLKTPPDTLLELLAGAAADPADTAKLTALAAGDDPDGDAASLDVLAVLHKFPGARPPAADIVAALDPLQPRLYSISSSQRAVGAAVHLTVAAVRWSDAAQRGRKGVASTHLADRLTAGTPLGVYVQKAHGFGLPLPDVPIVMVGPGTGIAPFRAFLQERAATAATGGAWLFFGDRSRATDFLYEQELAGFQSSGALTRLSLAFSRDQAAKVYVQDRMREDGAELWAWLARGAHCYVCGDASRMAADVEKALVEVAQTHGDVADGKAFVKQLAAEGRYARDVY